MFLLVNLGIAVIVATEIVSGNSEESQYFSSG